MERCASSENGKSGRGSDNGHETRIDQSVKRVSTEATEEGAEQGGDGSRCGDKSSSFHEGALAVHRTPCHGN